MSGIPFLGADEVAQRLPVAAAVDALEAALLGGLDPDADAPRSIVPGSSSDAELLVMPSALAGPFGVKVLTVRAESPRIQGVYVLFDAETQAPALLIDGVALTAVRTAAVSAVAVKHLASSHATSLLVYGRGPQGVAHVEAMRAVLPGIERVEMVGRAESGDADVAEFDVVCCCTTARSPLFDGADVKAGAVVVAVGSHEPTVREVDSELVGRAAPVVVESRASALREAGDVIQAIADGALDEADLSTLSELVNGYAEPGSEDQPRFFKSVGMSWEDAVLAAACAGGGP